MRSVRCGPKRSRSRSAAMQLPQGCFRDGFDRRRAVAAREQAADRVHHRERRRARREGEQEGSVGARREPSQYPDRVRGPVVDQRVHGDDVIETTECRIEHVAGAKLDAACAEGRPAGARAPARSGWARGRSRRRRPRGARPRPPARRCRSRRRAAACRGDRPAARRAACGACASRPARTVARMRPTGAVGGEARPRLTAAVRSK